MKKTFNAHMRVGVNTSDALQRTKLYQAVADGNIARARELLENRADPDLPDTDGHSPLHVAVRNNDYDMVCLLLSYGARTEGVDKSIYSPLMYAVRAEIDSRIFDKLLEAGADIERLDDSGFGVVHHWAQYGDTARFVRLVEYGADFGRPSDKNQMTPLHIATLYQKMEHMHLLAGLGVNMYPVLNSGHTPMDHAVNKNFLEGVAFYLNDIAKNGAPEHEFRLMDMGKTPMIVAVEKQYFEMVQMLVAAGMPVNDVDGEGQNALVYAIENKDLKMFRYLMAEGSEVLKLALDRTDGDGVLHRAVEAGHPVILMELLMTGLNPDDLSTNGTPMGIAIGKGDVKAVKMLLRAGADVDAPNAFGQRPLDLATDELKNDQAVKIVEILLDAGADVNISPVETVTVAPVHKAIEHNNSSLAIKLLEHGPDIELRERREGFTPFLCAVHYGCEDVLAAAQAKGADIHAQTHEGKNALHIAAEARNWDIFKNLEAQGVDPFHRDHEGRNIFMNIVSSGMPSQIRQVADMQYYDSFDTDHSGHNLFHLAAMRADNRDAFATLADYMDKGIITPIDPNVVNGAGDTPMHILAQADRMDSFQLLVMRGGKVNRENKEGLTVADVAGLHESLNILRFTFENGADPKRVLKDSRSYAHIAARKGNARYLKILHEYKAPADLTDNDGNTPLHLAALHNNGVAFKYLLNEYKVAMDVKNKDGKTPLDLAEEGSHTKIVEAWHEAVSERKKSAMAEPDVSSKPPKP